MNPLHKNIMFTLLIYAAVFLVSLFLGNFGVGGACGVSLSTAIIILPIVFFFAIGLFVNHLILALHKKPGHLAAMSIHLVFILFIVGYFYLNI